MFRNIFKKTKKVFNNMNTFSIAENWGDVKVSQFNAMLQLDEKSEHYEMGLVSILSNMDIEDVMKLPVDKYEKCLRFINFLSTDMPVVEVKDRLKVNGKVFKYPTKMDYLTTEQYISLQQYAKNGNAQHYIAEVVATITICDDMTYQDKVDWINEHMSIVDAYSIMLFFSTFCKKSILSSFRLLTNIMKVKRALTLRKSKREEITAFLTHTGSYIQWIESVNFAEKVGPIPFNYQQ